MGVVGDAVHALFVLLTTFSYALPTYEGIQRRSPFYVLLFMTLGVLSFVLHCEETGLCRPLESVAHAWLQGASNTLSYFLLTVMLSVVFEVRNDTLTRFAGGLWALFVFFTDPSAMVRNTAITFILSVVVLIMDIVVYKRKFTATYFRRLGLIFGIALVGMGLFKLLNRMWLWHGIWHLYFVSATYLLLLAQRTKRMLANKGGARDGGASGRSSQYDSNLTTPVKRRGAGASGTPGSATAGAVAAQLDGSGARSMPTTPSHAAATEAEPSVSV